jgi:septal ring factor EnvC (AmiA/AmiB activator)
VASARSLRLAAACIVLALPAQAARDPAASNEELKELRQRIESLQRDMAATEKTRGGALEQLKDSEKALSEAHRALFALTRDRRAIEGELASIADQDRVLRESAAGQRALAERLLRLQYRQGATDRLRLLLEGRDAATVARHLAYYGYIQKARAQVIVDLRDKADRLHGLDERARERRDALAANEAEQARQAQVLEKDRIARADTVKRLAGDIEKQRREIGRLKKDEARLARLVEEIARTLAAKPAPKPPPTPGKRVESVADASLSAKPFESLKGRLRMPVKGELVNSFGAPREETGVQWKGLFIRSTTGETVHAIADGRVVYADWLRGFGNLLILDHGGGYMSLYANNEGLVRQVGENVRSGDAVAQVGSSGGIAESGLYFELRRDGKPFDPLKWIVF